MIKHSLQLCHAQPFGSKDKVPDKWEKKHRVKSLTQGDTAELQNVIFSVQLSDSTASAYAAL